jgi:hypothetical protein
MVVFSPDPERGGRGKSATAETGPDGAFQLQLGNSLDIPAGWYRVALAGAPLRPDQAAATDGSFPARLARPDLSGLEREIRAGETHVFEFFVDVPNR